MNPYFIRSYQMGNWKMARAISWGRVITQKPERNIQVQPLGHFPKILSLPSPMCLSRALPSTAYPAGQRFQLVWRLKPEAQRQLATSKRTWHGASVSITLPSRFGFPPVVSAARRPHKRSRKYKACIPACVPRKYWGATRVTSVRPWGLKASGTFRIHSSGISVQ